MKVIKPKIEKTRLVKLLKPQVFAPLLSKEQDMLQEMFGGSPSWGTGESLPKVNGVLISGNGLIKSDDGGETGSMFGF
jgi:hypothetical protein